MWYKHHKKLQSEPLDPSLHRIGDELNISLEDLQGWVREFKNAGMNNKDIEGKIDQSIIEKFIYETEKRYGRVLFPKEREFALQIFLEP